MFSLIFFFFLFSSTTIHTNSYKSLVLVPSPQVPPVKDSKDLESIATHHCNRRCTEHGIEKLPSRFVKHIVEFSTWFDGFTGNDRLSMTLRDILSWIDFLVLTVSRDKNSIWWGFVHGAALSVLDGLATATDLAISEAEHFRKNAFEFLLRPLIEEQGMEGLASEIMRSVGVVKEKEASSVITSTKRQFGIKPFLISKGPDQDDDVDYAFDAPTTRHNLMRLLRALQLERRPILLEGSPGVGKTSLVMALGKLSGNRVTRINLSDQTDLSDLFGADLPCSSSEEGNEDGAGAMFKWVDGALLRAMRKGEWCLIDELNLAGQPVLEGFERTF